MTATGKSTQTDTLMEQCCESLANTRYFHAERLAVEALALARQSWDLEHMRRIIMPLLEARRQRLQPALDVGKVTIIDEPIAEDAKVEMGCYLLRPPQVGAAARRLRLLALEQEVPVAVVCREPQTQLGLCPIVAIGPGATIRTKIDEPANPEEPDLEWFIAAMQALGDFAIDSLDPGLATLRRIDALMNRLDAIPDHEQLHLALEETCRRAQHELTEETSNKPADEAPGHRSRVVADTPPPANNP